MADPLVAEGYHVRRWLGQEPWGQAHLVVDDSGSFFSAKTLELPRLGIAAPDPDDPDFQRLVTAIRSVSHPGVLNVHDVIIRDGLVYLIEEYLHDQRDLSDILRRQRFIAPEAAWKLACQLCHGVHFLHERGIIHLRLRPQSILIGRSGLDARIADAGVMAVLTHLKPDMDRRPWVANTVCPVWLSGAPTDRSCDTYSIGVTMREALQEGPEWNAREQVIREEIRRFSFLELERDIAELEDEIHRKPPSARDPVKWIQLRRVICDAAHPEPEERYPTAAALGKAIASARHEDQYGPEDLPTRAAQETPGRPRPRKLTASGVIFCQVCGRPATGEEKSCKSCGAPLVAPREAEIEPALAELDIDLQEVRDWYAEAGDDMAARGKSTEAERAYRIAVYRNREDPACWKDLADMYIINRKFEQALKAYWIAARYRPGDPALRIDLGLALLANRRPEEAQREFTTVLNSPTSAEVRLAALTHLGASFAAQKRHMEAIQIWRGVLEERPFDISVHCSIAASYAALGNLPRAYDHVKVAVRVRRDSPTAQLVLRQLDRMNRPVGHPWSREAVLFIRLPLFLLCLILGWPGLILYAVGTLLFEAVHFAIRTDWGVFFERMRMRIGRREEPR